MAPASVSGFTRQSLFETFRTSYAPNNAIITAAGRIDHARLVDLAAREFGSTCAEPQAPADPPPQPRPARVSRSKSELGQAHICLGVPSYPIADKRRFAVSLLNNVLGGGMSSRLFQNIRERQGLAYAVFSDVNPYSDAGLLSVYAGTAPKTAEQLIRSVLQEFRSLRDEPLSAEELRRGKDQLKGSLVLSLESTGSRMSLLARHELYFGRFFTVEELLAGIEDVTADEIQQIAQESFQVERIAAAVLGPDDSFRLTPELLAS